jgi:orotidine-5'-phosphate decarboxylase
MPTPGASTTTEPASTAAARREGHYLDRLGTRVERTRTVLCLGIDPHPDLIPPAFPAGVRGIERFARTLLENAVGFASAVKLNLAFFESYGAEGIAALERVRAAVPGDIPVIADAKRGDIGSTAERHAVALFDVLGADAITASPYLGVEALEPFLSRQDRFVYVLCRTSNPGASELQGLSVVANPETGLPEEPLYLRVARRAEGWNARFGTVGLVVGATAPEELALVRAIAPALPFLVPGAGSQGGDVEVARREGPAISGRAAALGGGGLLVNVSRGIAMASQVGDPERAIAQAAQEWSQRLRC